MYGFKLKGYFPLFYLLMILLFSAYLYLNNNPNVNFTLAFAIWAILLIVGSIIIYFSDNFDNDNIYILVFIIIICFGLFNTFLTPVVDVCDESEHFWRSEITSQGVLVPDYVSIPDSNQSGYKTLASLKDLYPNTGNTVFETDWDDRPINHSTIYTSSAFSQNPFYGYLAQAIGIGIAKALDLNNIWMLWFGRICNLILYAAICSFTVKKSPIFKMPLLMVACLPLAVYQAASLSIDSFVNASCLLSVAYFLYMYDSGEGSLTYKNAIIFFALTIVGGLTKVTYLALAFLIFLVPKVNFKEKKDYLVSRLGIIAVIIITLLWTIGYATPVLNNSWRGQYSIDKHVNAKEQISFMISHPEHTIDIFSQLPSTFIRVTEGFFSFANLPPYGSKILAWLYAAFFAGISLFYPIDKKVDKKTKIGVLAIFLIIYFGIIGVQYLTWCSVGAPHLSGFFGRYFIPLLALIPICLASNIGKDCENINILTVTFVLSFLANAIMLTVFNYY